MMKKHKNCDNCGAPLPAEYGQVICPYCGTVYAFDSIGQVVVLEKREGVIPFSCLKLVDMEAVERWGQEALFDAVQKEIARDLTKKIMPLIDFRSEEDIERHQYSIRGSIRVLDNQLRF